MAACHLSHKDKLTKSCSHIRCCSTQAKFLGPQLQKVLRYVQLEKRCEVNPTAFWACTSPWLMLSSMRLNGAVNRLSTTAWCIRSSSFVMYVFDYPVHALGEDFKLTRWNNFGKVASLRSLSRARREFCWNTSKSFVICYFHHLSLTRRFVH